MEELNSKKIKQWINEIKNVVLVYKTKDGTEIEFPKELLKVFDDIIEQAFIPLVSKHLEKKLFNHDAELRAKWCEELMNWITDAENRTTKYETWNMLQELRERQKLEDMLKIKDNEDLKELEKFGFERVEYLYGNHYNNIDITRHNGFRENEKGIFFVEGKAIDKLSEYENFMEENGFESLEDIKQLQQENKQLKQQLAEKDKLLENAIVPKFEDNEKCFITKDDNIIEVKTNDKIFKYRGQDNDLHYYLMDECYKSYVRTEQYIYATREEAEEALKKLNKE